MWLDSWLGSRFQEPRRSSRRRHESAELEAKDQGQAWTPKRESLKLEAQAHGIRRRDENEPQNASIPDRGLAVSTLFGFRV